MSGALAGAMALAVAGSAATGATRPTGLVFGGVTPEGWPVHVELNKTGKQVRRAVIGLDMTCTSGASFGTADTFSGMVVSKTGRFQASVGPEKVDAGGVPAEVTSKMIGRRNKARTSMRGIWSLKVVVYDATGTTVVDTCESGIVNWTARQ